TGHCVRAALYETRVRARLPRLPAVPDHRHDRRERADVARHDDAVAGADRVAVQADGGRPRRRLEPPARLACRFLRHLIPMDSQQVFTFGQQSLYVLLMVSAPILLAVLAVGRVVSIFQAATQIHEATLSFVPKIVAAVAVLAIAGPWMLTSLVEFLQRTLQSIPTVVG